MRRSLIPTGGFRRMILLVLVLLTCLIGYYQEFNVKIRDVTKYANPKIISTGNNKPEFVLGMLTPHMNTKYRDGQRSTWISTIQQLDSELPFRITYKFLIDRPTNDTILENKKYNDIVFLNATSEGRGVKFGEKLFLWFKYIYENFPDAVLGAKVDDDTFLCVPQIFTRLDALKSSTLYYGWSHGSGNKVDTRTRIDEMFVVLGQNLIKRIAKRKYCTGPKCDPKIDLIDTNYGGTSLGSWLSIYNDIDYRRDNDRILHRGRGKEAQILKYIKPDFCSKFVLNHKSSVEIMKKLHEYNKHQVTILPHGKFIGAVTGSLFSGDVVRKLLPHPSFKRYRSLATLDKMPSCSKWAVVFTISPPSKAVKNMTSLSDWCLVIVADTSTPPESTYVTKLESAAKRVKYLSVEEQSFLYPLLSDIIPFNHFGRKNIGYMYAIHHKAKFIWDFDDDNDGTVDLDDFKTDVHFPYVTICKGEQDTLVNPYPYFGVAETYTWPRGFPLQDIKNKTTIPKLCNSTDAVNLGIIQSLANDQPDIDAVYRMTRDAPFNFQATRKSHRPFVLPGNSFAPVNSQATLWLGPAFPYLALPISINGRVSDIWRGYIAQYFLHRKDIRLAFSPPYVIQDRNVHNVLRDFNAELSLYQKSKQLVSFLSSEKANSRPNIVQMYEKLYTRNYLEKLDVQFAEAWVKTLNSISKSR
ncbi:uncharacterized protein LOC132547214 [Ylistrum balloti]|uniref:uncharacterized protein LOC132547214 n=1 Tax=Ylistrum balloti TaxID=509963 RepID=UPI0029058408|nr:uncharacterized protein LOC132547214 [Ylistrum balloti]